MNVRVCLSCCNRVKGPKGRCPFCGGTVITDTVPDDKPASDDQEGKP